MRATGGIRDLREFDILGGDASTIRKGLQAHGHIGWAGGSQLALRPCGYSDRSDGVDLGGLGACADFGILPVGCARLL